MSKCESVQSFFFFFYLTYLGQLVKPRYEGSVVISLMYF